MFPTPYFPPHYFTAAYFPPRVRIVIRVVPPRLFTLNIMQQSLLTLPLYPLVQPELTMVQLDDHTLSIIQDKEVSETIEQESTRDLHIAKHN